MFPLVGSRTEHALFQLDRELSMRKKDKEEEGKPPVGGERSSSGLMKRAQTKNPPTPSDESGGACGAFASMALCVATLAVYLGAQAFFRQLSYEDVASLHWEELQRAPR